MTTHTRDALTTTALAAALVAVFGPGQAVAAEAIDTSKPESRVSIGGGYVDQDNGQFGKYNGLHDEGAYLLLDADAVKRDDTTGTWLKLRARNLGLDTRDIRFDHKRQGNWGYYLEYNEIPRFDTFQAVTAVQGIGTSTLTIPTTPTSGTPIDLETKRKQINLGFDKIFVGNWNLSVDYRNEKKDGARIFARGTTGNPGIPGINGNFEFAPEPIDSTIQLLEAKVGYTGQALQLSGGYYATRYNNEFNGLNFIGGVGALSTFTPIALPPDNRSQQLYLTGGYNFTNTTRGTFKASYQEAKQDDAFVTGANVPLAPGIGNNLEGKVEQTILQAGVTSRPMPRLFLLADFKREDRDDKTPIKQYFTGATTTSNGDNEPRSISVITGKAEASYSFPSAFRLTGGIDYVEKKRNILPVLIVSHRPKVEETAYRVELRRSMSETLTGALSYVYSDRDGSAYDPNLLTSGAFGSNLVAPVYIADRTRDKVRLTLNWLPAEPLSLQFFAETAEDDYKGQNGSDLGPHKGKFQSYSIDGTLRINEKWQATAWYTWMQTEAKQKTCEAAPGTGAGPGTGPCPATAADPIWGADLESESSAFGIGVRGTPAGRVKVGAELTYTDIKDSYSQFAITPSTSTVPQPLPNVTTRLTRLNLWGDYAIDKHSGLRLDYIYDRYKTDDWTWTTWQYVDGTVLVQDPDQQVNFVGVRYYYTWR
jgi:MtrB/PioB family decaheme-associated outer membrane protein